MQCLRSTNKAEQAIFFRLMGLQFKFMLTCMLSNAPGDMKLTHLGWTNHMSNFPFLLQNERDVGAGSSVFAFEILFLLLQEKILGMKDIICEFIFPSGVVVGCFAWTIWVANKGIHLPQLKPFVGLVTDAKCIFSSLWHLAPFVAR